MGTEKPRILIVDDERLHINMLNGILKENYILKVAMNGQQAVERAASDPQPDLILLDVQMPDMDGFAVLRLLKQDQRTRGIPVIFITALNAEEEETRGLEMGAVDYITKPFSPAIVNARIHTQLSLQQSMHDALEAQLQAQSLEKQVGALNRSLASEELQQPEAFSAIITHSSKMQAVFHYMEAIADSSEPVLVTGETGVGKELIAQALHQLGGRQGKMLSVNLAGLDDTTFSDTLFGHKKGAFTGADQDRQGFIAQAEGGTLFLDEIGDLQPASQIKLLRLLQEKLYYPLGSDQPRQMQVTIIAATHRDLSSMMHEGSFRQDLFFRLSAHHIKIPPLRQRREDIPLLTGHFLEEATQAMGRGELVPPDALLKLLALYDFPGNIRELRAMVLDAAAQHRSGPTLSMQSIQQTIEERRNSTRVALSQEMAESSSAPGFHFDGPLPTLEEAEQLLVAEAMRQAGNNQGIAASLLGISRTALNRRLNRRLKHLLDGSEA
uniref:Putative two component, sigma54 specific, transcriptional regulator, Fis family n=1 Tax=Magnetococcus massalia (strain MO-1) TaxID=451514 RepID=A0A1S7LMJ0_MAGMO|nr:Putative two component, sigma54 specific, transcriptional regulator, Fis family [Candidatus Magnetococcus massalia]